MKKLLFVLKDMNIGGVEKAFLSLLSEIDQNEFDVTLLLLKRNGGFIKMVPSWVNITILEGYQEIDSLLNNPPLSEIKKVFNNREYIYGIELLIGYIYYKLVGDNSLFYHYVFKNVPNLEEKYDIAISYTSIILYITYFVKNKVHADTKIGWIHFDVNKIKVNKKTLYNIHKKFNKIYIVSRDTYNNFIKMFPKLKEKCEIKYNTISKDNIIKLSNKEVSDMDYTGLKILTLGRLSKEKGQDMIPSIAFKLKENGILFKWYLIGDGALNKQLYKDISSRGLDNEVIILGSRDNPYPYLRAADIYVQTSRYEGYCTTTAEAKCLNKVVLTTNVAGMKEQFINQETGSIVEASIDELYKELVELINNKKKRCLYQKNLFKENSKIN